MDYAGDSSRTTSQLGTYAVRDADDAILTGNRYEYDANGNITKIYEAYTLNGSDAERLLAEYEYDVLNQLTKETRYDYSTTPASSTVVSYTVDAAGNLRTVSGGGHTVSYTYGDSTWADLLTGVSLDGVYYDISYASPGNPSNWFNESVYTNLTWTQGRRLSSITAGGQTFRYEYDMSGIRTVKIADGLKHEYVTQNGRVVRETATNASTGAFQYALDFTYDEAGNPLTMRKYNNADMEHNYITMHYVCNAQGDVMKLIYSDGTVYASYSYDAWGNVLTATENGSYNYAALNPLRYRGYYYDTETGFYYLQSRYYDPIVKRFLNADSYASTGQGFLGYNMFAYCENNPPANIDSSGTSLTPNTDLIAVGGAAAGYSLFAAIFMWAAKFFSGGSSSRSSVGIGSSGYNTITSSRNSTIVSDLTTSAVAEYQQAVEQNSASGIETKSIAGSTPATPPDPSGNGEKHSYQEIGKNKVANKIAQKYGYENAEEFKASFVGQGDAGKFNIGYDKVSNEIVLIKIQGKAVVPTGYIINFPIF